jgi:hypothetical protein
MSDGHGREMNGGQQELRTLLQQLKKEDRPIGQIKPSFSLGKVIFRILLQAKPSILNLFHCLSRSDPLGCFKRIEQIYVKSKIK